MTKAEIRAQAKDMVVTQILNAINGLTKIDDYTYAIRVGTAEDNGNPLYAKIEISAPNWYDCKNSKAFDLDTKVAAYEEVLAERSRKAAEKAKAKAE